MSISINTMIDSSHNWLVEAGILMQPGCEVINLLCWLVSTLTIRNRLHVFGLYAEDHWIGSLLAAHKTAIRCDQRSMATRLRWRCDGLGQKLQQQHKNLLIQVKMLMELPVYFKIYSTFTSQTPKKSEYVIKQLKYNNLIHYLAILYIFSILCILKIPCSHTYEGKIETAFERVEIKRLKPGIFLKLSRMQHPPPGQIFQDLILFLHNFSF